jgi:hypothetical protein
MLHVAVREFAGGESLLLVLLENGSGCAKASMSERSRGWEELGCIYVYVCYCRQQKWEVHVGRQQVILLL